MSLIINVYFASHGKGDLEEEKAGRGVWWLEGILFGF